MSGINLFTVDDRLRCRPRFVLAKKKPVKKTSMSIRIRNNVKRGMDNARDKMIVKESQTQFIEAAIYQRSKRIIKEGTV